MVRDLEELGIDRRDFARLDKDDDDCELCRAIGGPAWGS